MPGDLAFSVSCACAELMRLEESKAPAWKRNAQRRHAKALTRRFRLSRGEEQAALGREVDGGSMPSEQMGTAA